jgi:hypothetical protein
MKYKNEDDYLAKNPKQPGEIFTPTVAVLNDLLQGETFNSLIPVRHEETGEVILNFSNFSLKIIPVRYENGTVALDSRLFKNFKK